MYILSGQYSFKVGDQSISGGPGTCVFMPRGVPHAWKYVGGDETGRAFFVYTPGEAGKAFEEAERLQRHAALPTTTVDNPFLLLDDQLLERCGWKIVGPPPF
jgi:hypothetical protein